MKTNRIKFAGLALATVVGTNAILLSPTYAAEGDISIIKPEIANIVYGEDTSFQAVTLNVKNNSDDEQKILGCSVNHRSDFAVTSGATEESPITVSAKAKSVDSGCKVTLKETGHQAGETLEGTVSIQYKRHYTVYEAKVKLEANVIKKTLPVPTATDLTYNGEEQTTIFTPTIDTNLIEVSGDITGQDVDTYYYSLSLKDKNNYQWNTKKDKTKDKIGSWKIKTAKISPTLTIEDWTYGDTASEPVVTGNIGDGKLSFVYFKKENAPSTDMPTDAGDYMACVYVAKTKNTTDGRACTDFTINKRNVTVSVTGKNARFVYDGLVKSVSGYSAVISDQLYSSDDYSVSGKALDTLSATEIGFYTGDLSAEDFTNLNENFNATFVVTPHTLAIEAPTSPIQPVAPITPTKSSTPYAPNTGVTEDLATNASTSASYSSAAVIIVATVFITTCGGIAVTRKLRK